MVMLEGELISLSTNFDSSTSGPMFYFERLKRGESDLHFIKVENVPEEVINEIAFMSYGEVLSLEQGYIFSDKEFDLQNLIYYYNRDYPEIRVQSVLDPTNPTKRSRGPNLLDLIDYDLVQNFLGTKFVTFPTYFDLKIRGYNISPSDYRTLKEWWQELGWAEAEKIKVKPLTKDQIYQQLRERFNENVRNFHFNDVDPLREELEAIRMPPSLPQERENTNPSRFSLFNYSFSYTPPVALDRLLIDPSSLGPV